MPKKKSRPGPNPDQLAIEGDWREAVKKALGVERPPEGWPEGSDKSRKPKKPSKSPKKRRKS